MIQKPQSGGLFRNTKPIRVKGEEDDELYNVLENIVNGSKEDMKGLTREKTGHFMTNHRSYI